MSKRPIKFEFNAAVQEALKNFPILRESTAFYDLKSDKIYKSPEYEELLRRPLWQGQGLVRSSKALHHIATKMQIMLFYPNEYTPLGIDNGSFEFDHELAHLIDNCNNSLKDPSILQEESLADAFASIRHFQRFNTTESDALERINIYRSLREISNKSGSYLTSPVTLEIIVDRDKVDFLSMSLTKTFNKAVEYVEKYSLNKDEYSEFKEKYALFAKMDTSDEMLELLSSTCLSSKNKNIFIIGAQVFLYSSENNPKWKKSRLAVKKHAKKMDLTYLLFKSKKPNI